MKRGRPPGRVAAYAAAHGISKQKAWHLLRAQEGFCYRCGQEKARTLCAKCKQYQREYRLRKGHKPREEKHVSVVHQRREPDVDFIDPETRERQRLNEERAARRAARRTDTSQMDWTTPSKVRYR